MIAEARQAEHETASLTLSSQRRRQRPREVLLPAGTGSQVAALVCLHVNEPLGELELDNGGGLLPDDSRAPDSSGVLKEAELQLAALQPRLRTRL